MRYEGGNEIENHRIGSSIVDTPNSLMKFSQIIQKQLKFFIKPKVLPPLDKRLFAELQNLNYISQIAVNSDDEEETSKKEKNINSIQDEKSLLLFSCSLFFYIFPLNIVIFAIFILCANINLCSFSQCL